MSRSRKPSTKLWNSAIPHQLLLYHIIPRLHPHGWKLNLTNAEGDILYQVLRRSTNPPSYTVHALQDPEPIPFTIRVKTFANIHRYTLYRAESQYCTLRPAVTPTQILLQDASRRILGRFIPITSQITLLRNPTSTVARIRFKTHPSPSNFILECKLYQSQSWLLALLLYAVASIEKHMTHRPKPPEMNHSPESTAPDTP